MSKATALAGDIASLFLLITTASGNHNNPRPENYQLYFPPIGLGDACREVCPPKWTIVREGTQLESLLVQQIKANGYSEIRVPKVGRKHYGYRLRFPDIQAIFFIPPKIKFLDGTVRVYQEGVDFTIDTSRRHITVRFRRIGYFLLSVFTSTTQENILLNVGMRPSCENICTSSEECEDDAAEIPRHMIVCPPNNECHLFSHQAVFYIDDDGDVQMEPVGNSVVVRTCDEIIEAVCNKSKAKGGKVDVYFEGHGASGLFDVGEFNGPRERVEKGSDCYDKICMKLKDKINTLTLYTCGTAGGEKGKTFIQCLANCLDATVQAWEKTLYIGGDDVESLVWSTQRGFTDPVEVKPNVTDADDTAVTPTRVNEPESTNVYSVGAKGEWN